MTKYTPDIEDDVFEQIESAVIASAPTPSVVSIAKATDHSDGLVRRAIARLEADGRIIVEKVGTRNAYSIPGENGRTEPAQSKWGQYDQVTNFDPVLANRRFVAALAGYFRRRQAEGAFA